MIQSIKFVYLNTSPKSILAHSSSLCKSAIHSSSYTQYVFDFSARMCCVRIHLIREILLILVEIIIHSHEKNNRI